MKETRYAILIGMNNYAKNPLLYSIKDVNDVKEVLLKYCKFDEDNIFTITDSKKPVLQQINETFATLQNKFQRGTDLLVFYYSGHGEYDTQEEKSILYFEDESSLGIGDIVLNNFEPLKAKSHYLIIDACHSGKNVYVREKHHARKMERKLLNDSRELYFLFAAEENKKAFQGDKLQNSYYTFYFVDAIKNSTLYDEDGWLTMNSIDEHIRKKLSNHKDVIQIPGSESRTTGYKPFAFLSNTTTKNTNIPIIEKREVMENSTSSFDLGQSLSNENRQVIQDKLKSLLHAEVENYTMDDLEQDYEIISKSKYEAMPYDLEQELEKAIIKKAQQVNLEAINNLFKVTLLKQNRKKVGLSAMFDMIHGEPEPEYSYDITYNDNYIVSAFIELKAKSFENTSGGLYCLFYQAKYGFVFCKTFFKYEWDGTHEKVSNFVKVALTPYRLIDENIDNSKDELVLALRDLSEYIKKWNTERKHEIATFLKNAK